MKVKNAAGKLADPQNESLAKDLNLMKKMTTDERTYEGRRTGNAHFMGN